jgi:hypothetical protein
MSLAHFILYKLLLAAKRVNFINSGATLYFKSEVLAIKKKYNRNRRVGLCVL